MNRFLTGIAAGFAIGYLTAPRSGKETRKRLTDAATDQTKSLKKQWAKTVGQVTQLAEDVKKQAGLSSSAGNAFADKASDKANRAKSKDNDSLDTTAQTAKTGVDKVAEALKQ